MGISTCSEKECKKWTEKYHDPDPKNKCFGGKVIIEMNDGSTISEEINVADAHPSGKRPFGREQYIEKFRTLTDEIISRKESERFLMLVQNLKKLKSNDLKSLNIEVIKKLKNKQSKKLTIF